MKVSIKEFIVKYLEKKGSLPKGVGLDTFNFVDAGYVDSMGMVKFLLALEMEFGVEISEADILSEEFKTVDGLAGLIEGMLKR